MQRLIRNLWIGALLFAGLAAGGGYFLLRSATAELHQGLRDQLVALRESNVDTLTEWIQAQQRAVATAAEDASVRAAAATLVEAARGEKDSSRLAALPEQQALARALSPTVVNFQFASYLLVVHGKIVAATEPCAVGLRVRDEHFRRASQAGPGTTVLRPPARHAACGGEVVGMWVSSPLWKQDGTLAGVLAFLIDPEGEFTNIFTKNRFGKSGEVYAFDDKGQLLSLVRFGSDLKRAGLVREGVSPVLNVRLLDPGTDLTRPSSSPSPASSRMTQAVERAISGETGANVSGYRSYRGREVVGAWRWLSAYDFGVVTEVDKSEAYRSVDAVRRPLIGLVLGLVFAAVCLLAVSRWLAHLHHKGLRAVVLGPYTLEEKLGEGGMGEVYKAQHALLRRPTAVKVIRPKSVDARTLARFEREVQATAMLCHPSTIAVYDYGQTKDGVFYYAMEYLRGVTLHTLVNKTGKQPEARVIHILLQVLASLSEAHEKGMVHRDVKPPNIMLCERGGALDLVKVLDFGLVKQRRQGPRLTRKHSLTGTPHFMSPEAVLDPGAVDARSDLYSVGAVGHFLLSARLLFDAPNLRAVLTRHMVDRPLPPSLDRTEPLNAEFEALLMKSLEKQQSARPRSAREMKEELENIRDRAGLVWSERDAAKWWSAHQNVLKL